MRPRSFPHRALLVAATLAIVPATGELRAQDAGRDAAFGLRGGFDSGGFPNSPATAPLVSPEDDTPPSLSASPTSADDQLPDITKPVTSPADSEDPGAPNYGKPRKKKPKLFKPNPKQSPPLPALVPYRGSPGTKRELNPKPPPADAIDAPGPSPTVAVIPSPVRARKPLPDDDPFKPVGVEIGTLRLLPYVETSAGYETNPNQVTTGVKPSSVLRAEGGFDAASDWDQHSLTASLRGGYSDFPSNSDANRPDANGVVDGRIDVTRDDQINLEARMTIATQTPGSPLLAAPLSSVYITNRPTILTYGATLGGTHVFNRLSLSLKSTFDRTEYGNAQQSNGTTYLLSQENYNDYGGVARLSYELTPALIPFVEAGADTRVHDDPLDLSGYYRNSVGVDAKVGSTFEFTKLLTGTLSGGYADRHYADPRLPNLRGPTIDGALVYTVTPLTTVKLTANTTLAETTLPGVTGVISRAVSLELDHQLFRRFTLSGIATYQPNQYEPGIYEGLATHEYLTAFTAKGAYSVSRDVQLIASASRQNLTTTLGDGFTDYVFLTGIRLQR